MYMYVYMYICMYLCTAVWLEALLDRHAASADEKSTPSMYICISIYVCVFACRHRYIYT